MRKTKLLIGNIKGKHFLLVVDHSYRLNGFHEAFEVRKKLIP